MNIRNGTTTLSGIVFLLTFSLAGCLTDEESIADVAGNELTPANNPPTISGNPQSAVMMGNSYSFVPTASDPDGDTLTFSLQNLPIWAAFELISGAITGNPTMSDIGVFDQIVITVSDGTDTASLAAFSIEVSQAALGSMMLTWMAPTENTDGTALTDLAGYRIYYGKSQGNYPNRVDINNVGLASYVVENLVPDTYYIVATSVNSMGAESAYSNVVIRNVQ